MRTTGLDTAIGQSAMGLRHDGKLDDEIGESSNHRAANGEQKAAFVTGTWTASRWRQYLSWNFMAIKTISANARVSFPHLRNLPSISSAPHATEKCQSSHPGIHAKDCSVN
jgi:hypothetical protein